MTHAQVYGFSGPLKISLVYFSNPTLTRLAVEIAIVHFRLIRQQAQANWRKHMLIDRPV